jgi:hypothetical protein
MADPLPVAALEKAVKITRVKVGIGGIAQAGGAFMTQPEDRSLLGASELAPFSAMAGFSPGMGVSLDVRAFNRIGLEVNAIRSIDTGLSHYTVNDVEVPFRVTQPSVHVPVLLKLSSAAPVFRPNLQVGAQFIVPLETQLTVDGDLPFDLAASADPYMVWVVGLGAEIKLPFKGADIRLPIAARAGFNTPYGRSAAERAIYALDAEGYVSSMDMDSAWQYHGSVTAGLTWYWPK